MTISEELARIATNSPTLQLEGYNEFVGIGVVPASARSKDMVVAVYVSKPASRLSETFKSKVPGTIDVESHGHHVKVATKIVNVGDLTP